MRNNSWVFIVSIVLIISLFTVHSVLAGPSADNSLELTRHNTGQNVGISVFSGYRSKSDDYRGRLRATSTTTEIKIDVPISKKIIDSWLYIYTYGYDEDTYSTTKINGISVSGNKHIENLPDNNRQTLRINNVSQYIKINNTIKFTVNRFGSFSEVSVDGASLVVVYEDTPLREFWIYDGSEYLSAADAADGARPVHRPARWRRQGRTDLPPGLRQRPRH